MLLLRALELLIALALDSMNYDQMNHITEITTRSVQPFAQLVWRATQVPYNGRIGRNWMAPYKTDLAGRQIVMSEFVISRPWIPIAAIRRLSSASASNSAIL